MSWNPDPNTVMPHGRAPKRKRKSGPRGAYSTKHTNDKAAVLQICPCCGVQMAKISSKYTDRCVDCGKLYGRYATYKSLQRKDFTAEREALVDGIKERYSRYKAMGYKVPRDIYCE